MFAWWWLVIMVIIGACIGAAVTYICMANDADLKDAVRWEKDEQ